MNLCFFKQKTAYELRIRAWSSGVCSSYLAADHLPALRAREVGVGDRGGDDRPANNGRGGQRNRGTVAGSGRDRRQDGSGEWILEARLPVVARVRTVRHNHRDVVKSEEHTSELQSLMRISYAVFCLKKKNNTKKTTITQITKIKRKIL